MLIPPKAGAEPAVKVRKQPQFSNQWLHAAFLSGIILSRRLIITHFPVLTRKVVTA